jgi:hypothetical protein
VADTFICDALGHVGGPAPERDLDNLRLQEAAFGEPGSGPVVAPAEPADLAARLKTLNADLAAATKHRDAEAAKELYPVAYGVSEDKPVNVRIQLRGEPDKLGDEVPRRFIDILGGDKLPADELGSGRLELANWLTRPSNPLTARVFVNRVWQWHFGQGLVPAILCREVFLRTGVLARRGWLGFCVVCFCLALSATYEFAEWAAALLSADGAEAFLGTQGDVWDTQWDMLLAGIGALSALVFLSRAHDRSMRRLIP